MGLVADNVERGFFHRIFLAHDPVDHHDGADLRGFVSADRVSCGVWHGDAVQTGQDHIKILLVFAFLTDSVLKIFGWVVFLDQTGPANFILAWLGLPALPDWVIYSRFAAMLGMVYSLLPFAIFTIFLSVDMIDRTLLRAAYDCGASKWRAFWEITLPLCRNGLIAGALLVFVLSLGAFLEPRVMGGGNSQMAAELIRQTFETRINWPLGSALTLVLLSVTVISILLVSRIMDLSRGSSK